MSSSNLSVGQSAFAVTPHDSTNFTNRARALYVGGAGNVACVFADGAVVTFTAVPTGCVLPVEVIRVNSTNTTATNIVGLV